MCPYCESYSCFKTKEVFIQELNEKYGQEYTLIGDYLGTNTNTLFKHNDCGFIFQNKPHNILGAHKIKQGILIQAFFL